MRRPTGHALRMRALFDWKGEHGAIQVYVEERLASTLQRTYVGKKSAQAADVFLGTWFTAVLPRITATAYGQIFRYAISLQSH